MAGAVARRFGLNERQAAFVKLVISGVDPGLAYAQCGYSGTPLECAQNAATLMRHPAVLPAIHTELGKQLAVDAIIARRVAVKIMQDESVSEKVRADLAVKMLRLAGHVEPRAAVADNGPVKTLSEMSTEELRARAAQLEDEIASRARPIRATSEPSEPQPIDIIE